MTSSLWNGISGISTYQNALNVESNNLANVNTVAFKQDRISFADLMYQNDYGKGSKMDAVTKSFLQGNMSATASSYDMAIEGEGFFTVQDQNEQTFYTRAGNFKMGADGTLQTVSGLEVMGLAVDTPTVVSTNALVSAFDNTYGEFLAGQSISSSTELKTINAKATDYKSSATTSDISDSGNGYKIATAKISDVELLSSNYRSQLSLYATNPVAGTNSIAQITTATYPPLSIDDTIENISIYVDGDKYTQDFDTDAQTTLKKLSDQISNIKGFTSSVDTATGVLTVTSLIPGKTTTIGSAKIDIESMVSQNTQEAVSGSGLAAVVDARDALKTAVEAAGAEFLELTDSINLANEESLTLTSIQLKLDNLNISSSPFGEISINDGNIYMKQGDSIFLVGRVVTSLFNDNLSLDPKGNNLFVKTAESGDPVAANDLNNIVNKALELSNSNVGEGLVNLMVYQRSFEANSKSITTSDELLKTALQLKK
ncbi:MAG: flagellar hook-basal body complex protein [Arcobacteraceae bacterium]|nr:flagellar hook-basal body complex protein [Arcobacteraceae bacterium]